MTVTDRLGNVPDGLAIKTACDVATTTNITLSGLQTIDGIALEANQRVLVWQQTDQTTNGIYQATTGPWVRPNDANNNESFIQGTLVLINSGAVNGGNQFIITCPDDPIVIGTSLLTWEALPVPIGPGVVTYSKIQNESAHTLLGNPTASAVAPSEITLGATFLFSGSSLRTASATGDVTWASNSFATTIAPAAVTLAKMSSLAASSFIGNNTGVASTPFALTPVQATAMLNTFTSALAGLVPPSGGGTTNFLRADGTFTTPSGGGTVTTSGSPSNGQLAQFVGSTVIQALPAGQIPGTASNDSANTGNVGEFQQSVISAAGAVTLTASGAGNVYVVTSKSLNPGDWEASGIVCFDSPTNTAFQTTRAGISTTSNTMPAFGAGGNSLIIVATNPADFGMTINPQRISISSTAAVYLLASASYTSGSPTAYGELNCRRMR